MRIATGSQVKHDRGRKPSKRERSRGAVRQVPRHVAIIMDGNGRWARERGLPRTEGHRVGAGRVREVVEKCIELGIGHVTVYAFSKENWKRPKAEVNAILRLSEVFFKKEFDALRRKGVYFAHLGEREGLPAYVLRIIERMERNNTGEPKLRLNIAFNYSGRSEIVRASRKLLGSALAGGLGPGDLTEERFGECLDTAGTPDPDLLIRTGGEMRVSNFLLWQIAYAEIWVTDTLWPDFTAGHLLEAVEAFGRRERRFGEVR